MIFNLKTLGIAFVAMLAMSVVGASAAHATAAHFRAGEGTGETEITLEQDPAAPSQIIKTHAGNIACQKFHAIYKGPATAKTATLENIEYKECELGGLVETWNFGTCDYTIGEGETFEAMGRGPLTLGPAGCQVTNKTLKCTMTIKGEQTFANSVTYTNVQTTGKPEEITGHISLNNLEYTTSASCPGGAGSFNNGVYEGTFTARAFQGGSQVNLTVVDT